MAYKGNLIKGNAIFLNIFTLFFESITGAIKNAIRIFEAIFGFSEAMTRNDVEPIE